MAQIRMVRLGDICKVVSGTTPKTENPDYWDGNLNWITPAEITDETVVICESQRKITQAGVKSCGLTPFPAGTVILSSRAPIGKTAIAGVDMYCNQGFKNLICSDLVFNKYLFWFLRSKTDYLNFLGRGATFKEISKKIVEEIEIPLVSMEQQQSVAAILDKVSAVIAIRKRQLAKLDELVKARFVEMFGDLTSNPMRWNFRALCELCDVRDGTHDSPQYCESGYPLLTSKNFSGGFVDFSSVNYISKKDFDAINMRSKVDYGDIIMPMIGTIGHPVIVKTEQPFAIKNVALIKFTNGDVLNLFIKDVLDSAYFTNVIAAKKRGNTQKFLSLSDIRETPIPVIPVDFQKQYAAFVSQSDKSRLTIRQGLDKMETLKQALMQEYFG